MIRTTRKVHQCILYIQKKDCGMKDNERKDALWSGVDLMSLYLLTSYCTYVLLSIVSLSYHEKHTQT